MHPWHNKVGVGWLCCPGRMCGSSRETSSCAIVQGTLVHSCHSLLCYVLKSGIGVHELNSTKKKKMSSQAGNDFWNFQLWCCLFPSLRVLGGRLHYSFPTCTFFFFFEVEISSRTPVSLFRAGSVHSGLESWDNCGWVFPDELHVSSFC